MMISNNLNFQDYGGYTKMTARSLNVNAKNKDKSKHIIMHKTSSDNCSMDVSKSKHNIVNKPLLQKNPADVSEYTIT